MAAGAVSWTVGSSDRMHTTRLARSLAAGEARAADELFPLVYAELKGMAVSTRQQFLPIREKVERLFDQLRQHEATEGTLLQEAYVQDEGG